VSIKSKEMMVRNYGQTYGIDLYGNKDRNFSLKL